MELREVHVGGWHFIFSVLPTKALVAVIKRGQWDRASALTEAIGLLFGRPQG